MQGIVENLPFDEYAKEEGLNASVLAQGRKSMLHMKSYIEGEDEDTPAKAWGRVIHIAVLEPENFGKKVSIFEGKTRRGKAWDEFIESNKGVEIISKDQGEALAKMMERVHAKPEIADLLKECSREVSLFWDGPYGRAKCRLDAFNQGVCIADVKTTGQIDPRDFTNTSGRLWQHGRLAWYQHGVEVVTGNKLPVYIICVEQKAPFDSYVLEYDSVALAVGFDQALETAMMWRKCQEANEYPGVQDGIGTLHLPKWMVTEHVESLEEVEASEL